MGCTDDPADGDVLYYAARGWKRCKHCKEGIADRGSGYVHMTGEHQIGLHRCALDPYGYDAEPEGEPCSFACRGYRA